MTAGTGRRVGKDETHRAYDRLVADIEGFMDLIPSGTKVLLHASAPDGVPEPQPLPPDADDAMRRLILPALVALDATMPLQRDRAKGVWETLMLQGHGHSGNAWIVVVNAIGQREHVTTFGTERGNGGHIAGWARSRRESEDLGTSWDIARRERRVVQYDRQPNLVDQGVNRVADILSELGLELESTCEGHPWGAHLSVKPRPGPALADAFRANGWAVEGHSGVARMGTAMTTAERDANWRALCSDLERRFDIEPLRDEAHEHQSTPAPAP